MVLPSAPRRSASVRRRKPCTSATSSTRGRETGADRPHRLVGDDGVGRLRLLAAARRRAGARPPPASGPPGARPRSRRCRRSPIRPARCAASALAFTSRSRSPWSARRSEWPTITAVAPASFEHLGRDVAGVGAACGRMAVLGADQQPRPRRLAGERGNQRRRRADHGVDAGGEARLAQPVAHAARLAQRGGEPVHLPVPRHQRPDVRECHGLHALSQSAPSPPSDSCAGRGSLAGPTRGS